MSERVMSVFNVMVVAGGFAIGSAVALAQVQNMPDAQIEANVLRALAGAPELSTQMIQSSTVYGTVTLTGSVQDEEMRVKAETLAARAQGVKKVVDSLTLGGSAVPSGDGLQPSSATTQMGTNGASTNQVSDQNGAPQGQVLQSDGTYAPANAVQDQSSQNGQGGTSAPVQSAEIPVGQGSQGPSPARRPLYQNYGPGAPSSVQGGQQAGLEVTVPQGAVLRVRINRGLDSNHIQPGTPFDGIVMSDVIAGGAVAVPRGATVQGTVIDAKKAGVFKGQGELGLQISSVTLGGNVYPIGTEVWQREGRDKTASTVNSAVGLGALGAIFGAVAGGGAGAAIGAGVGGAVGVAGAASSPRGQIIIPPESVLTFRVAQSSVVRTVSQAEMARLSYAAGLVSRLLRQRVGVTTARITGITTGLRTRANLPTVRWGPVEGLHPPPPPTPPYFRAKVFIKRDLRGFER